MPTICFGQQPCGFFPKRFLVAKIHKARELQKELGGKIVFFYHDSDADYRETITIMTDRQSGAEVRLNFTQENKIQKNFSPLYKKRVPEGWKEEILKQLPRFIAVNRPHLSTSSGQALASPVKGEESAVSPPLAGGDGGEGLAEIFKSVDQKFVADFCLEMYKKMGLLKGVEVLRSSDKDFRLKAPDLATDYFADVEYQGEIVRGQLIDGKLQLHEGGGKYTEIPTPANIEKWQKNPGRDQRFGWMQSVINCTHYVTGEAENDYLKKNSFPDVEFIVREKIDQSDYAWLE
jgi:hypothetical protein